MVRPLGAADQGSVCVSSAVPPLVAGSPITFADLGEHQLKGVPHSWHRRDDEEQLAAVVRTDGWRESN
jgi:hypothetical protein